MPSNRDKRVGSIEYLKVVQPGLTNDRAGADLGVSRQQVGEYRKLLKDGFEFLGSRIKVEVGRNGKMKTTVHPLFLLANSSEAFALLRILLEYRDDHPDEYLGYVADELAGKIHFQLTPYGRGLVDRNLLRCGWRRVNDVEPEFIADDRGPRDPYYLTALEKRAARVVVYCRGENSEVNGRVTSVPHLRHVGRGAEAEELPTGCLHLLRRGGEIVSIPTGDIVDIDEIGN